MNLAVLLGTIGAGLGLAVGLAFNLRLARVLGSPLSATFVAFLVGGCLLLGLWLLGLDGSRPPGWPVFWTLLGGVLGASYVTLSLIGAARLGVGVSTVAVTLGQVVGALVIAAAGWFGQTPHRPTLLSVLSAVVLLAAVALLALDREQATVNPEGDGNPKADGSEGTQNRFR
jgi:bacterial/archaeal transporter family-2 protein